MHRVWQTRPPRAPKYVCNMTGATSTFEAESRWASGLIYAAIGHCAGADAEMQCERREHTLMLTLGGGSELTRVKISGSPVYEGQERAGCVTYESAGTARQGWYRNANVDFLLLLIDPAFVRSCESGPDASDLPPFTNARDPMLESVLWSLAHEMRNGAADLPSVYAEHAAGLLTAHLIQSVRRRSSRHQPRAGLSDSTLHRVTGFIEESLGQDISLTALAALAGTGVDAFARNFKARMGVPPYRYLLERRMRRAQTLLASSGKSIAEIAFEVGFSSQAHFTTQFSKVMNVSPAAYRAMHRR
jgi:AraC family transcriptional regulator